MLKFNHWLPKFLTMVLPGQIVNAIVLFQIAYFREKKEDVSNSLLLHEFEHVKQQKNDGLMFYINYALEYFKNLVKYKKHYKAYSNISYEIEAVKAELKTENVKEFI